MKKAGRWLGVLFVAGLVMAGAMAALAEVPPGFEPEVRFVNPEEFGDTSANSSGKSAVMDGSSGAQSANAGSFWGWLGDHGMGLVKGIGAGLIGAAVVVGVAVLVVGAGAPLLLMAGAAVLGGAVYGALVGSKNFNWTEAIVGSVIGGVSAGVGSWIAGTGSSLVTRAAVAAVDMVGGGLASVASYLIHEQNPTLGGTAAAFGIGAGTAGLFIGVGALVSKGWAWTKGALGFGGVGKNASRITAVEAALADPTTAPEITPIKAVARETADTSRPLAASVAGTPQHKAARWETYQARSGEWSYERWSKQYDTNMQNVSRGLGREKAVREAMGGQNRVLQTPYGSRQIDILLPDTKYVGQVKTGKESLTSANKLAIEKDKWLVEVNGPDSAPKYW